MYEVPTEIIFEENCECQILQGMFQKELYNDIQNVAVRQMLGKGLHLKAYKLSIVPGVER
jgi:hypothetical protein